MAQAVEVEVVKLGLATAFSNDVRMSPDGQTRPSRGPGSAAKTS
jgi:hypothetical protein